MCVVVMRLVQALGCCVRWLAPPLVTHISDLGATAGACPAPCPPHCLLTIGLRHIRLGRWPRNKTCYEARVVFELAIGMNCEDHPAKGTKEQHLTAERCRCKSMGGLQLLVRVREPGCLPFRPLDLAEVPLPKSPNLEVSGSPPVYFFSSLATAEFRDPKLM
jgi:hypothetical protein